MAKVLIFLADGFEEIEGLTVVDLLRRAGIDITTVSITDKPRVTGSHKISLDTDTILNDVSFDVADMLVLPGGMPGTRNLEACDRLMSEVDRFAGNSAKKIAAICAAPTIFGHRGLLHGKKACCYPGKEGDLTGAKVSFDEVSVDGNIITSRGLGTAIPFSLAIIEALTDKATADKIGKAVVYRA